MQKILVILGPTATGKTDLGLDLAKKFNGELVACDSRQVYRGLDIGTGKMPGSYTVIASPGSESGVSKASLRVNSAKQSDLNPEIASSATPPRNDVKRSDGHWQIDGINVWMYDLIDPREQYSAFDWAQGAIGVIGDIRERGKLPIIVGGTGLYLKALLEGLDNLPPADPDLRVELEKLSLAQLKSRVATHSPARWEKLNNSDENNPRRLIRIIEQVSMYPYINKYPMSNIKYPMSNVLKIGLTAPRSYLNSRIDQRVFDWFDQGILKEVKDLIDRGVTKSRFKEFGLEYRLIVDYLEGKISSKEELIKLIQTKIRQYAKRQMTWFKKEKDINWFDITDPKLPACRQAGKLKLESLVRNWYNQPE